MRQFVAALAYRMQKALRDAPLEFANFRVAPGARTLHALVRHMSGVLNRALGIIITPCARIETLPKFGDGVLRFHGLLEALSTRMMEDSELPIDVAERPVQGPLADAMIAPPAPSDVIAGLYW